jgi:hypothetical protein
VCTALAIIQNDDGIPMPQVFPIAGDGSPECSVGSIDLRFAAKIDEFLQGFANFTYPNLGAELLESTEWQRVRHAFDASGDIILTAGRDLGKWKHPTGQPIK